MPDKSNLNHRSHAGFLADRSIRFKLLLYFVVIIVVSIVTLSLVGSTLYRQSIEEETNTHTSQMMNQVKNNIQTHLKEMDNLIYYIARDTNVLRFLRGEGGVPTAEMLDLTKGYETRHTEISGILLVNAEGDYSSNRIERVARDPLTKEQWYIQATSKPEQLQLFSHPIGRNIRTEENISADQVLSFVKAVQDPISGKVVGAVLIDMQLDFVRQIIESASLGKSGFIYLMDAQGGIIYSPVNKIVYRIEGNWLVGASDSSVHFIQNREYQIMHNTFVDNGWRVVGVFPLDESLKVVNDLQWLTVLIAIGTLFIAFVASWFFTNSITRPVQKLRSLMKKVEAGELHLRFRSRSNDEIGQLGSSFNRMVEEIENLIQMVYEEQRAKREAELKILQSQIKPHFLYNTLDTIQWMAQERNAPDIAQIVVALTHLFRIGLSKGNEIIPLSEELKHVESYLIIQLARYEDKLTYHIELPDALRSYNVLKLILQPLVENAIYHGIKLKKGSGRIDIHARREEQCLYIQVSDDGVGIPPEKLAELREMLGQSGNRTIETGFGLYNVHERIRLTYGEPYGLTIESGIGEGTIIVVCIPELNGKTT
jgi:two-component system sensor histidine kinase YesM